MDEREAVRAGDLQPEVTGRLRAIERVVDPLEIADLWVFPPLPDLESSAEFLLFTRYLEEDRRRLYSARMAAAVPPGEAEANGDGAAPGEHEEVPPEPELRQELVEHGSVPADRVARFVERFRRRLGEEDAPLHLRISGSEERWNELLGAEGEEEDPELRVERVASMASTDPPGGEESAPDPGSTPPLGRREPEAA